MIAPAPPVMVPAIVDGHATRLPADPAATIAVTCPVCNNTAELLAAEFPFRCCGGVCNLAAFETPKTPAEADELDRLLVSLLSGLGG